MNDVDNFQLNIDAVKNLVGSKTNKTFVDAGDGEGVNGPEEDYLSIKLSKEELLELRDQYENEWSGYYPKIEPRQKQNKLYLTGMQRSKSGKMMPVSSNLLFEATATFVPAALAKNPEPVVWSDNTPQGKQASSDLKTMLQFHATTLGLREKLSVMVWHWSVYFTSVLKYGWDVDTNDVKMEVRKPQNFLLDPNGYIDEFGNFIGWLGERCEVSAKKLIEMYPSHKEEITVKVNGKLGTKCTYTEWWDDEMCFSTFYDIILDAHKNEFFNYPPKKEPLSDTNMLPEEEPEQIDVHNHFAKPMKPYTFLSVFSLQEQPHDFTNLIEQNLSNQDQINDRDAQIDKNARQGNNSLKVSGLAFNQEIAHQAAQAIEDGDPILIPNGDMSAIDRIPANELPSGLMEAQENNKNTLRSIYGTQGVTASSPDTDQTAHGMVINSNRDASRIGGGIGDSLERVARGAFNYLTQLYYVFYDEPHFASIMGNGAAVSYVMLQMQDQSRRFVVEVSPNSMKPKDEVSEQNLATQLMEGGMLDPLSFFERIDDADPTGSATRLMEYKLNPQGYMQQYLSPQAPQQPVQGAPPQGGANVPDQAGQGPTTLSEPPPSGSLSQAPLPSGGQPKI
jgi:hypothetical protein